MQLVHWILILCCIPLLFWANLRCQVIAPSDGEHAARRDMVVLITLLLLGVVGDATRSRFPNISMPYLIISIAMLPVALWAIVILIRLIQVFRRTHSAKVNVGVNAPKDKNG